MFAHFSKDSDASRARMSQADRYRGYAKACIQAAKAAVDDRERGRWLGMAQHWLQWAQEEEGGRALSRPMPTPLQPVQPQAQQQQQPQPNEKKE
jgi:hypothetical protein